MKKRAITKYEIKERQEAVTLLADDDDDIKKAD